MNLHGRKMENGRRAREIWEFVMFSHRKFWLRLKIFEANCCKDMQQHRSNKFIISQIILAIFDHLAALLEIQVMPLKRMQSPFAAVVFAAFEVLRVPWC